MASNLDARALSSLSSTTDPTQYKAAFDGLKQSVDDLQKPLTDINKSVSAIAKSLTDTTNAGDAFKKKIDEIASSYSAWKNIMEMVNVTIAGTESVLTGGLALITAFAPQLVSWISDLTKGETKLSATTKAIKDTQIVMNAVDEAKRQGTKNAQPELTQLEFLYNASQKQQKDKLKDIEIHKQFIAILKQQWAVQFKGYTDEAIMTGKAKVAYDALKNSIIASEQVKTYSSGVAKNKQQDIDNQQRLTELNAQLPEYQAAVVKAETALKSHTPNTQAVALSGVDVVAMSLQKTFDAATVDLQKLKKQIADVNNDMINLGDENGKMQERAINLGPGAFDDSKKDPNNDRDNSKLKDGLAEAEQMKAESAARQLQITMLGYSNELLQENAHYDHQAKALRSLLDNKLISQKEYNTVSEQLEVEHHTVVGSLIDKFNSEDAEKVKQLGNEISELTIKNEKDGAEKQKHELKLRQNERIEQYEEFIKSAEDKKTAIANQMKMANPGTDLKKLKTALDNQEQLIQKYRQKRDQDIKEIDQSIQKIDDQANYDSAKKINDKLLKTDQKTIDNAGPEAKQAAEKQLITDKYKFEIDQARITGKDIEELKKQETEDLKDIDDKYAKQKADADKRRTQDQKDFELQTAQQVSNAAFSIVKNGISSQADAKVKQLEAEKNSELSNTSLTAAQKQAIQQNYQKKEAAVKARAFKDEQLASIGQALINGALAVTKATAQTGVLSAFAIPAIIAETAVQVATIAAQKPPAYAKGGVHYSSDGRGGVLPGYSRTDNTNAYLRSGEGIVVSEAMRVPWARNLVSAINVGFGGRDFSMSNPTKGFAVGGVFTDGGNANRYYNQPVHDQKNLANTIAYQMINNFPPVYVDVKDINNQQNILAQTINRVNL